MKVSKELDRLLIKKRKRKIIRNIITYRRMKFVNYLWGLLLSHEEREFNRRVYQWSHKEYVFWKREANRQIEEGTLIFRGENQIKTNQSISAYDSFIWRALSLFGIVGKIRNLMLDFKSRRFERAWKKYQAKKKFKD